MNWPQIKKPKHLDFFEVDRFREQVAQRLNQRMDKIDDANGTLGDVTTKFNLLLSYLKAQGIMKD